MANGFLWIGAVLFGGLWLIQLASGKIYGAGWRVMVTRRDNPADYTLWMFIGAIVCGALFVLAFWTSFH